MNNTLFKFYTLKEITAILKIDRRNVYRYIKDGRLVASKLGREWRVNETDLINFLDRTKNTNRR